MKRRKLLQSILAAPALAALPRPVAAQSSATASPSAGSPDNFNLAITAPDAVGQPDPHFFTPPQRSALEHLGDLLVPKVGDRPGSREANVARFLEFLISKSPSERRTLYTAGLDRLNSEAARLYQKPFAAISAGEAKPILKPLEAAWTYAGPSDPFAQFLQAAKEDVLRASVNSPAYAAAANTRSAGGLNYYWLPVE